MCCGGDSSEAQDGKKPKIGYVRKLAVDLVNPKFKSFSHPLCLAFLVGIPTIIGIVCGAIYLTADDRILTFLGDRKTFLKAREAGVYTCVKKIKPMSITHGSDYVNPEQRCRFEEMDMEEFCDYFMTEEEFEEENGEEYVYDPYYYDNYWENYNDGESDDQVLVPCEGENQMYIVEYLRVAMQTDPFSSFGQAMGFAPLIEMFCTVMILMCTMPCGCIRNLDPEHVGFVTTVAGGVELQDCRGTLETEL